MNYYIVICLLRGIKSPPPHSTCSCPLCQSEEFSVLSNWDRRLKKLRHVKCSKCGLVRQDPLPSEKFIETYYKNLYRTDYQGRASIPSERHRKKRFMEGTRRLEKLKPLLETRQKLLDLGCGSGEFVELCASQNLVAKGFEPGKGYATYARESRGLNVICTTWQNAPVSHTFDVITAFHVFEHLVNPLEALSRITTWLDSDGLVFIETPNLKNCLNKGFGALHFAHTLGFTRPTLEYLGALCGLKVVTVFDEYDIGIVFSFGTPRPLADIELEARRDIAKWNKDKVHKQFWLYTLAKIPGFSRAGKNS